MICTVCEESMKFKGVGYRGERKNKEFWKCRCGNEESIDLYEEVKETRIKKTEVERIIQDRDDVTVHIVPPKV